MRGLPIVRVLEEDPELCHGLPHDEVACAEKSALARALDLAPGPWAFNPADHPGAFGVLLLSGAALTRVSLGKRVHAELLADGDVVLPWLGHEAASGLGSSLGGYVVCPTRVALLDRAFATRTAQWPEIASNLLARAVLRARRLSLQAAVNAMPRIQDRLEITLWLLADRFGRMTPDGVVLDLPLTHQQVGCVIGAARPSVTSALTELRKSGRIEGRGKRSWYLCDRPEVLQELSGGE